MNIKEGICTGIGVIGSIIASAFGGLYTGLVTLLIFMGIDYFSGLVVAGVERTLQEMHDPFVCIDCI